MPLSVRRLCQIRITYIYKSTVVRSQNHAADARPNTFQFMHCRRGWSCTHPAHGPLRSGPWAGWVQDQPLREYARSFIETYWTQGLPLRGLIFTKEAAAQADLPAQVSSSAHGHVDRPGTCLLPIVLQVACAMVEYVRGTRWLRLVARKAL